MTDKMREAVARAIWNIRREEEDRCDMELEDMGAGHSVWAEADAAIGAMREAMVIELPPVPEMPDAPEEAIDDSHMDAYHSAIGMRHACSKFIEAAGLKVKP